jgi:DNA modification methylase
MSVGAGRPDRQRRALSHVGGPVEVHAGTAEQAAVLKHALEVGSDERAVMAHVHGFHPYPARLHPVTAGRLISGLSARGAKVLDPFCGSGTVLLEARLAGRRAIGIDANPLAVELAWLKTRGASAAERASLIEAATGVSEHAAERRRKRSGPTRPYGRADRDLFDTHVLLELDGLKDGLSRLPDGFERRALLLVLSSLFTKVSKKRAETTGYHQEKRLAGGFVLRFFLEKANDLAKRLAAFTENLPARAPEVELAVGDARRLEHVRPRSIDLVVTSPPYPGVYDYHDQHAARLRWLGLSARRFERAEVGARRRYARLTHDQAIENFRREFAPCLAEIRRCLASEGAAVLVIADSVLGRRAVHTDEILAALAVREGLRVKAHVSQVRPHFHLPTQDAFSKMPRREHVMVLALAAPRPHGPADGSGRTRRIARRST